VEGGTHGLCTRKPILLDERSTYFLSNRCVTCIFLECEIFRIMGVT
jgi:hypothetical protein